MTAFSTLNVLPEAQLTNLNELGYLTMTPVQAAALPAILEGRDVRVQAKTGSGKTAAFGLGLLQHIDATLFQTQSLILCPTRELSEQVADEAKRLAAEHDCRPALLVGGRPMGAQLAALREAMKRYMEVLDGVTLADLVAPTSGGSVALAGKGRAESVVGVDLRLPGCRTAVPLA